MKHFIDGGSNIGQTFDLFLNKTNEYDGWRVWCFELSARNIQELLLKIQVNQARYDIVLCPFGIYDKTGYSFVYEKKGGPMADSLFENMWVGDYGENRTTEHYSVMAAHVDIVEFILKNIEKKDTAVLKLDVGWSEYAILNRLLKFPEALERIEAMYVEWHNIDGNMFSEQGRSIIARYKDAGKPIQQWMF